MHENDGLECGLVEQAKIVQKEDHIVGNHWNTRKATGAEVLHICLLDYEHPCRPAQKMFEPRTHITILSTKDDAVRMHDASISFLTLPLFQYQ